MLFIGTSTPLPANGVWRSDQSASPGYPVLTNYTLQVTGSAFSDQAGTLYVEQSGDGINWDISDSIAVTANTGAKVNIPILLPYLRFRYVNGITAQTVLRIFGSLTNVGIQR